MTTRLSVLTAHRPNRVRVRTLGRAARALAGVLSPHERMLAAACGLAVLLGIGWGVGILLRATTVAVPAPGGTLIEGTVGQPRFVLPILAPTNDVDMDLSRLVYNGLLTVGPAGALTGDLATAVEASADGKTYTARLRAGVFWHDGEPFTANDVVLTIRLLQDPAVKSPLAHTFQGVTVEAVDEHTVRFRLTEPYAPFQSALTVGILPAHVWGDIPPQGLALAEHAVRPIGTGPFRFEKLKRAELSGEIREYRLVRNERYHGSRPLLDGITVRFSPSTEDLLRSLRRGEVDAASLVPPADVAALARTHGLAIKRLRLPQYFAVFFNQAKSVPLADPAVRRALAATTNRDALIAAALHGEGTPTGGPLTDGMLGYAPELPTPGFDLDRARQNLDEAGWRDADGDGLRENNGTKLHFTLSVTDQPEFVETAQALADQWRAIGVDVMVAPARPGTMQADVLRPRNYEALLYGQVLGPDPDLYPFWHSTQTRDPGLNLALFKDRKADQALEAARKTTDREERAKASRTFQERLLEEVPAIFLYNPTVAYAVPAGLSGTFLERVPLPSDRYATVHTWYLKTRRVRTSE